MNTVEKIKLMCKEKRIPISKLEKECGFANGYIGQLKKGTLPVERAIKVADFLGIPVDILIGDDSTAGAPSSGSSALDRSEQTLLDNYRLLNNEGQDKLQDYASDLVASGRYIKDHTHEPLVKSA